MHKFLVLAVSLCFITCGQNAQQHPLNVHEDVIVNTIKGRINVPIGYKRILTDSSSFGFYFQNLPLKAQGSPVFLYNGVKKSNQQVHFAVINLEIGTRDLQQCADAVMRLRADYLYGQKRYEDIAFNFVSDGNPRYLTDYCNETLDSVCYKKYLNYVFSYANTRSLKSQLHPVASFADINIGDVLIQQGNPYGHAVIVVDMATHDKTGEKIFLLAQSYMPAQDIHVLKNLNDASLSPWYRVPKGNDIITPEWRFEKGDLRRF